MFCIRDNKTHKTGKLCNVSTRHEMGHCNKRLKALKENNTWSHVPLLLGKKPIGCRWVYKIKYHSDGSMDKYKVILMAKGYNQQYGIDYVDTFCSVAKLVTVRTLLALAATNGCGNYVQCMW